MKFLTKRQCIKFCYKYVVIIFMAGALMTMSSCGRKASNISDDILTQKAALKERTQITVLVKYAFSINSFEEAVETKFPDIDIVQVGNYTKDMGISEYESRLEHDDIPDIVMTWPLEIGEDYWEDRLIDLSGFDFTSKYNLSMLNEISRDGKLYYLPGPSQVRGILYNKTLFEEKGWQVPSDFEEFIELCKTIEASGIRSLQLGFKNSEVLDTAFTGYGYADCFSQPQDSQWIKDYNEGKGSFGEHFKPALDTFQRLIDEGIFRKEDLDIDYSNREEMIFTRKCAMIEDSVLLARMGYSMTGITDEFGLMPFFNPNDGKDWARLYMVCYIGMNKHLTESKNKEKYDLAIKLMEYISTPEGQEALMGDTGAMFSSLTGMSPPDVPEIEELLPALNNGRYGGFPQLKNAQKALRDGLAGMLRGNFTKEMVIKMVDWQNSSPPESQTPQFLGTASENFTMIETGNFITDCMKEESGCDIALFLDNGKDGRYNGKGLSGSLYKGAVTKADIERILPDLKYGETENLCKVKISGEDLIKTLEYSIKVNNGIGGWFYYFSGLQMEYNPVAEPGIRIHKITTDNGEAIDKNRMYTVAIMKGTVQEEFLKSYEETNILISDILKKHMEKVENISPSNDGRFVIVSK